MTQLLTHGEIIPNQDRGKCIPSIERPSMLKGLQACLGAANYLRKYIPDFAQITKPLHNVVDQKKVPKNLRKKNGGPMGKKIKITWNEEALESLKKLQEKLCSNLLLALSDFTKEMIITTDASEFGYGGHVEQNFKKNVSDADELRPIEYFSRKYTSTQRKYSMTEKEMLAVVMTVENFHLYLYGRKFSIYTDHLQLTWMRTKKTPHPRIERWMMRMALYEFIILCKPGKDYFLANFLSRLNEKTPAEDADEENDYNDQHVASIEALSIEQSIREPWQKTN